MRYVTTTLILLNFCAAGLEAQGNYEVQVYASELPPKGVTLFELHTNYTTKGTKRTIDGELPTHHAVHETLEITHGFNEWFETGYYIFTSVQPDGSWRWVGTHIRPRMAIPERYHLPVGLSLSTEFGYQRPNFSRDTWTWEIRPIIDKQLGKLYLGFDPTFGKSFHGPSRDEGYEFEPNFKLSYDLLKRIAVGFEYYGVYGSFGNIYAFRDQEHMFMPAIDVDFGPQWEFNFGVGVGATGSTDHLLIKAILGYRIHLKK